METTPEDLTVSSSRASREMVLSKPETCRLCMEKICVNMTPIFNTELAVSIADKISSVTRLKVCKEDRLPTMVCRPCLLELDSANLFIERCTSSDRSLRLLFTEDGSSEAVRSLPQAASECDPQLVNSTVRSSTGPLGSAIYKPASIQGAVNTQGVLEDYAAPRCQMEDYKETSILENLLSKNNLTDENSINRSVESVPQMSIERLDMQQVHTDPPQMSSKISVTPINVTGVNGIRDNLQAICAIVALSNDNSLNVTQLHDVTNHTIKSEPTEPPAEPPAESSESQNVPDSTMPVLEIQTNWLTSAKTESNSSTQIQDLPNLVPEIKAENIESESTTEAASTFQTPKSVKLGNQKQPCSTALKYKCADCSNKYTNKRSLAEHSKLHQKQREKKVHLQTSKRKKQLFKTKVSHKTKDNVVVSQQLDIHSNATAEKRAAPHEEPPHIQQTEQQSPLSVQLSQLKRVLFVKLDRLPANYLSLINPVTPTKKQKVTKKYKCSICLKEYKDKWYLAYHIKDHATRTHPDDRPYKCKKCGKTFKNVPSLNAHIRHHNAERMYECEHCKKLFMRMIHLKRHVMTHSQIRPHKCQICGKGFKEGYNLKIHLSTHSTEKPFKCEKCFRAFKRESQFKEHLRTHKQPQKPKLWHRCVVCQSDFLTEQRLEDHLQIHKEKDSQANASHKQFQVEKSIDVRGVIAVKGKPQNRSDSTTKDKRDKIKVNKNSQQTGVRTTEKFLAGPSTLQETAGEKNYKCKICAMVCTDKLLFDRHIKTHTDENHYPCIICGKKFRNSKTLRAHKVLHRPSRPLHTCKVCSKTYAQRGSLARHMLFHTGDEPRFKCSTCQRGFIFNSALKVHERTHFDIRPYKCGLCDRSYRESYNMKLHMRIHNQERNYECSQCKTAFHRQSYLQKHMKIHEVNRKKYSCDNCNKSYFRRRSITGHMRKYHPTD